MLGLDPCIQEEADSRIMLHLKDIVMEGNSNVSIRTVDTDVVELVIKAVVCLGIIKLWVGFGVCKSFCLVATHETIDALVTQRCMALFICSVPSLGVMCIFLRSKGGKQ